jgi:hypothetical protein
MHKTVHWTVFRALEPGKPAKFAGAYDGKKGTRQSTNQIKRHFLIFPVPIWESLKS